MNFLRLKDKKIKFKNQTKIDRGDLLNIIFVSAGLGFLGLKDALGFVIYQKKPNNLRKVKLLYLLHRTRFFYFFQLNSPLVFRFNIVRKRDRKELKSKILGRNY